MGMRSLACVREVGFDYNIPLTRDSKFSDPYADPKVVASVGFYVFRARDAIQSKYQDIVKIDAQLDHNHGFDGLDRDIVTGYNFSIGFDRVDKVRVSLESLENAVFEFIDMVPLKPTARGALSSIFKKIKERKASAVVVN